MREINEQRRRRNAGTRSYISQAIKPVTLEPTLTREKHLERLLDEEREITADLRGNNYLLTIGIGLSIFVNIAAVIITCYNRY